MGYILHIPMSLFQAPSPARWIENARTRKQNGRKPPRQLFVCLLLSHLPHYPDYLRAWNRLYTVNDSSVFFKLACFRHPRFTSILHMLTSGQNVLESKRPARTRICLSNFKMIEKLQRQFSLVSPLYEIHGHPRRISGLRPSRNFMGNLHIF